MLLFSTFAALVSVRCNYKLSYPLVTSTQDCVIQTRSRLKRVSCDFMSHRIVFVIAVLP